jgi:hypothetical protein
MPDPLDIAELMRLADATTPGPWEYEEQPFHGPLRGACWINMDRGQASTKWCGDSDDGRLVAAAREAIPRLVKALRDLRDSYLGDGEGRAWCERAHGIIDTAADREREEGA